MSDVTRILSKIDQGDLQAAEKLLPLVYDELRKLAAARLAHETPGQTLSATALVHEAYLRLVGTGGAAQGQKWQSIGHFFGAAAEAMRRILVENARRKARLAHGGQRRRVELHDVPASSISPPDEILAIDEALDRLSQEDAPAAELVKLRYFAGMSVEEASHLLGVSPATGYRHWTYARAWIRSQVLPEHHEPDQDP